MCAGGTMQAKVKKKRFATSREAMYIRSISAPCFVCQETRSLVQWVLSDLPVIRIVDDPEGRLIGSGSGVDRTLANLNLNADQHILLGQDSHPIQLLMRGKMQKHHFHIATLVFIGIFILSACGSATGTPTATPVNVDAIFTEAAQTVIAQFTQQAPTITPTPVVTDTPTLPPATAVSVTPTVQKCEDALFVSDVTIPDGTQMAVNQHFTKTWRVQNTGSCTWITTFYLAFSYGEAMGGPTKVPLASAVAPGQTADLSVNLTVPNKTGKLTGVWSLFDDKGNNFGQLFTVVVNVSPASLTPTGNSTATPTLTATNTQAPTGTLVTTP